MEWQKQMKQGKKTIFSLLSPSQSNSTALQPVCRLFICLCCCILFGLKTFLQMAFLHKFSFSAHFSRSFQPSKNFHFLHPTSCSLSLSPIPCLQVRPSKPSQIQSKCGQRKTFGWQRIRQFATLKTHTKSGPTAAASIINAMQQTLSPHFPLVSHSPPFHFLPSLLSPLSAASLLLLAAIICLLLPNWRLLFCPAQPRPNQPNSAVACLIWPASF